MTKLLARVALVGLGLLGSVALTSAGAAGELERRGWTVDGVEREALVRVPAADGTAATKAAPVVFVFHGHGGSMRQSSRSIAVHEAWPEALVVYPQGLPTPGMLTDPEGKRAGWQAGAGAQDDRDLKFFDAMLADLIKEGRVDERRVYATGHSNGGAFTYLLWAERGDVFAAFAPSASLLAKGFEKAKPKPVLHIASPGDRLVKYAWQERMIAAVLALNGCGPQKGGGDATAPGYTSYASPLGAEVAVFLHDGGHRYPAEATRRIVAFFQAQVRP